MERFCGGVVLSPVVGRESCGAQFSSVRVKGFGIPVRWQLASGVWPWHRLPPALADGGEGGEGRDGSG